MVAGGIRGKGLLRTPSYAQLLVFSKWILLVSAFSRAAHVPLFLPLSHPPAPISCRYVRAAKKALMQAEDLSAQGDTSGVFIILYRIAVLLIKKIPTHTAYANNLPQYEKDRAWVKLTAESILDRAAQVKEKLEKEHAEHHAAVAAKAAEHTKAAAAEALAASSAQLAPPPAPAAPSLLAKTSSLSLYKMDDSISRSGSSSSSSSSSGSSYYSYGSVYGSHGAGQYNHFIPAYGADKPAGAGAGAGGSGLYAGAAATAVLSPAATVFHVSPDDPAPYSMLAQMLQRGVAVTDSKPLR